MFVFKVLFLERHHPKVIVAWRLNNDDLNIHRRQRDLAFRIYLAICRQLENAPPGQIFTF